jgi:hypothetical protein
MSRPPETIRKVAIRLGISHIFINVPVVANDLRRADTDLRFGQNRVVRNGRRRSTPSERLRAVRIFMSADTMAKQIAPRFLTILAGRNLPKIRPIAGERPPSESGLTPAWALT